MHCHTRSGQKYKKVKPIRYNSKAKHAIPPAALPPTTASLMPPDTGTPESANRSVFEKASAFSRNKVPQAEHVQSQMQEGELREGSEENTL